MIETTTSPAVLAVAPLASVVIEQADPDMRTLNCFVCGTVTIHTRTADGFACSACDTEQEVTIVEDFYGSKKERTHRR